MPTIALDLSCLFIVTPLDKTSNNTLSRYLIEGSKGAVLHTGDMRAEIPFIEELKRNKFINRYLAMDPKFDHRNLDSRARNTTEEAIFPTLEAIYLDTAGLCVDIEVPSKGSHLC